MRIRGAITLGVLLSVATALGAQSLADIAASETARRAAIATPSRLITNTDLPAPDLPSAPAEGAVAPPGRHGQEALVALRALQSQLAEGASLADFKRYYLDAKTKVDALPDVAEHAVLKEVADLYGDAGALMLGARLRTMDSYEIKTLKTRYGGNPGFMRVFGYVSEEKFGLAGSPFDHEMQSARAESAAQVLMHLASRKLNSTK